MKIILKKDNIVKECKVGFSWTMLFFGMWVPFFRRDIKYAGIYLIINVITLGVGHLPMCYLYNLMYIKSLVKKGWKPIDETAEIVTNLEPSKVKLAIFIFIGLLPLFMIITSSAVVSTSEIGDVLKGGTMNDIYEQVYQGGMYEKIYELEKMSYDDFIGD